MTRELLATCWTSAGDAAPDRPGPSPVPVEQRVAAVAGAGFTGMGLVLDDLRVVRESIGYEALVALMTDAGLAHTEVELVTGWWEADPDSHEPAAVREDLFEAATSLAARHVKVGPPTDAPPSTWPELVGPLRRLARHAATAGVRLALEPLPFSAVVSVPVGARLVEEVGEPNLGLLVDAWHVFRAGTTLEELAGALRPGSVFGVELNDADPHVVGTLFEDTVHRRRLPGEGCFDLDGLVSVLAATGFEGPWGVEMLSDEFRAGPLDDALRRAHDTTLAVLRRALGPVGPGSADRS